MNLVLDLLEDLCMVQGVQKHEACYGSLVYLCIVKGVQKHESCYGSPSVFVYGTGSTKT